MRRDRIYDTRNASNHNFDAQSTVTHPKATSAVVRIPQRDEGHRLRVCEDSPASADEVPPRCTGCARQPPQLIQTESRKAPNDSDQRGARKFAEPVKGGGAGTQVAKRAAITAAQPSPPCQSLLGARAAPPNL